MMAIMDISVAVMQVYVSHKLLCCHWHMTVKQELLTPPEHVSPSQILVEYVLINLKFSDYPFGMFKLFLAPRNDRIFKLNVIN